jgi:hypothetical protein
MFTRTYGVCLVTFLPPKSGIFCRFSQKLARFLSLFSVTLVTFHKATFNKINDLRGGWLDDDNNRATLGRMRPANNQRLSAAHKAQA